MSRSDYWTAAALWARSRLPGIPAAFTGLLGRSELEGSPARNARPFELPSKLGKLRPKRVPGIAALIGAVSACGAPESAAPPPPPPAAVHSVTIQPDSVILLVGEVSQLEAAVRDSSGNILTDRPVTWTVTGSSATVTPTGEIRAVATGVTTVTAESEGKRGRADVRVGVVFAVASAGAHQCGISVRGTAYCWGFNASGELGDGTTIDRTTPDLVLGGLSWSAISAGSNSTCGLDSGGLAHCWGSNVSGGLGNGSTTSSSIPVEVIGGHTFASISVGDASPCAVTALGVGYCWGANDYGQVGDGEFGSIRTAPVAVTGDHTFSEISAGAGAQYSHACGIDTEGAAFCWGLNEHGQLGHGLPDGLTHHPTPLPVEGGVVFASISAGTTHTCGLTPTGSAFCWGENSDGALGDGTTSDRATPVQVLGGLKFVSLSAGSRVTCGVTQAGAAYCWGFNSAEGSRLAIGPSSQTVTSPQPVVGDLRFSSISVGFLETCALTPAELLYCWGPTPTPRSTPTKVAGQP
jgi:hypothetical protein